MKPSGFSNWQEVQFILNVFLHAPFSPGFKISQGKTPSIEKLREVDSLVGPIYVVGVAVALLIAVSGIAWLYEKTRPKMNHPSLGELSFFGGFWNGLRNFRSNAIRLSLPGEKSGPGDDTVTKFEGLWSRLDTLLETVKSNAVEEFRDCVGSLDEEERKLLEAEVERDLGDVERNFQEHWTLVGVRLEDLQEDETSDIPRWYWMLEFEVSWDPEHTRTAYLNLDGELIYYDLTCVVFVPD